MDNMNTNELNKIINAALNHQDGREALRKMSLQILAETNEQMLADGVPEEIVAYMSANAISRLTMPSNMDIARSLFPIEPMPRGALSFFDKEKLP